MNSVYFWFFINKFLIYACVSPTSTTILGLSLRDELASISMANVRANTRKNELQFKVLATGPELDEELTLYLTLQSDTF